MPRTGDAIRGVRLAPAPHTATWRLKLHTNVAGGRRQGVLGIAVRTGSHAEVGDVLQTRRGGSLEPKRIHDILAVRPGLHQSGRRVRGCTHRRTEPGNPSFPVNCCQGVEESLTILSPEGEEFPRRHPALPLERIDATGTPLLAVGLECGRVSRGASSPKKNLASSPARSCLRSRSRRETLCHRLAGRTALESFRRLHSLPVS